MAVGFCMPALSHTMETGRVVEWMVAEGGAVARGDILVSIETDKSVIEIESPVDGLVLRILAETDVEYPVGATLAWIGAAGEEIDEAPVPAEIPSEGPVPAERVTPVARRFAERHGIDADALPGTGPDGRVTKADVQHALAAGTVGGGRE